MRFASGGKLNLKLSLYQALGPQFARSIELRPAEAHRSGKNQDNLRVGLVQTQGTRRTRRRRQFPSGGQGHATGKQVPPLSGGRRHFVRIRSYELGQERLRCERDGRREVPLGLVGLRESRGCPQRKAVQFDRTPQDGLLASPPAYLSPGSLPARRVGRGRRAFDSSGLALAIGCTWAVISVAPAATQ